MKQNQFVQQNEARWQQFEQLSINPKDDMPAEFSVLYRQVCNDLATARTRHYSPSLIAKLNEFVSVGQSILYQGEGIQISSLIRLFKYNFFRALFENRYYLWASFGAFYGLALVAFAWVKIDPDAVYYFLDVGSIKDIEGMYDPTSSVQVDERESGSTILMFGVYIYNNIGIAFQMFGGGALFGIGAIVPLLFNSFYFGAISAHIVNVGYESTFFSFVVTHGSFELTAITIAGAAGAKIGFSLLMPGQYSRAHAIKTAGSTVLPLIVGAFIMLVIAAVIEAFWSPLNIPNAFKYSAGAVCWMYVLLMFYRGTRYGHS